MSDAPALPHAIAETITAAISELRAAAEKRNERLGRKVVCAKVVEILGAYRITKKHPPKERAKKAAATDDEWLASLEKSPAYEGVNVRMELEKCRVWASTRPGIRGVSRRRFVNWLNRAATDKPLSPGGRRGAAKGDVYTEPAGWRDVLRRIGAKWDRAKVDELCRGEWLDLPLSIRTDILKAL